MYTLVLLYPNESRFSSTTFPALALAFKPPEPILVSDFAAAFFRVIMPFDVCVKVVKSYDSSLGHTQMI